CLLAVTLRGERFLTNSCFLRHLTHLTETARWSALLLGVIYGKQRFDYLKPIAEEERRVEEAEKKAREEQERIYKQLSEANSDTILK
uniref:ATP synthase F(0) complex subunit e, mitochondrial n=1 Tax=Oreochromis aureus TaxID=47969 RepID=A0AAZ1X2M9_OREAU